MASLNSFNAVGRATADPEIRDFDSGGCVANISFAINNRVKKDGEWVDDPCFIDLVAYGSKENQSLVEVIEKYIRKGDQFAIHGKLKLEQWEDKTSGNKRSKHKIILREIQLLESKKDSDSGSSRGTDRRSDSRGPRSRDDDNRDSDRDRDRDDDRNSRRSSGRRESSGSSSGRNSSRNRDDEDRNSRRSSGRRNESESSGDDDVPF